MVRVCDRETQRGREGAAQLLCPEISAFFFVFLFSFFCRLQIQKRTEKRGGELTRTCFLSGGCWVRGLRWGDTHTQTHTHTHKNQKRKKKGGWGVGRKASGKSFGIPLLHLDQPLHFWGWTEPSALSLWEPRHSHTAAAAAAAVYKEATRPATEPERGSTSFSPPASHAGTRQHMKNCNKEIKQSGGAMKKSARQSAARTQGSCPRPSVLSPPEKFILSFFFFFLNIYNSPPTFFQKRN